MAKCIIVFEDMTGGIGISTNLEKYKNTVYTPAVKITRHILRDLMTAAQKSDNFVIIDLPQGLTQLLDDMK